VRAADGTERAYEVRVAVEAENFTIQYEGISDADVLSSSFNQTTGVLTLTVDPGQDYEGPYEWRLDGQRLSVLASVPELQLSTADLSPGQHEIVVVVKKKNVAAGYPEHYTNKIYFQVQEKEGI
jgi:hypothetical protein